MRRLVAALGLLFVGCAPGGQTGSPSPSPVTTTAAIVADAAAAPRLVGPSMAYDIARSQMVLFGTWYWPSEFSTGLTQPASPTAETWTWRSGKWTRLAPATSPPARVWGGMAYDEAHRQVVLFGGGGRGEVPTLQDTWIWDGGNWSQRTPATSPPAAALPVLAYHAKLGRVVALIAAGDVTQTWTWDGSTWARLRPPSDLPGQFAGLGVVSAAYDPGHGSIVVFGGGSGDTWTFDGSTWARHVPVVGSPPGGQAPTLAYDPSTEKVVMFGGASEYSETWTWDGTKWTHETPADHPMGRTYPRAVADPTAGNVILYGGISFAMPLGQYGALNQFDVWTWAKGSWTLVQPNTIPAPGNELSPIVDAASLGLRKSCTGGSPPCISVRGQPQLGFYAGYVAFDLNPPDGQNSICISYVSYVKTGDTLTGSGPWHQVGVQCGPSDGHMPQLGAHALVSVTGCANVRTFPQVGAIVSCLPNGTPVTIDDGPVAIGGDAKRLWWHLQQRGWMAHELLAVA